MKSKVARWGNSLAVRLPKAAVDAIGLREGDAVDVETENGRLIVEPSRTIDLAAMIATIRPETLPDEEFDAPPVGRELL